MLSIIKFSLFFIAPEGVKEWLNVFEDSP